MCVERVKSDVSKGSTAIGNGNAWLSRPRAVWPRQCESVESATDDVMRLRQKTTKADRCARECKIMRTRPDGARPTTTPFWHGSVTRRKLQSVTVLQFYIKAEPDITGCNPFCRVQLYVYSTCDRFLHFFLPQDYLWSYLYRLLRTNNPKI